LNLADVGRDCGLPHSTLTRYMALLESVFLIHRLPAWSPNLGKRLVKAPKLHLLDTGLAAHLLGANTARLVEDRALLGRLLETFVVSELRKQLSWSDPSGVVLYLGDQTVPHGDQLTLVPVTALWSPSKLPPGTRDRR
jgi:predicted AAA+ superfamily ATPase